MEETSFFTVNSTTSNKHIATTLQALAAHLQIVFVRANTIIVAIFGENMLNVVEA